MIQKFLLLYLIFLGVLIMSSWMDYNSIYFFTISILIIIAIYVKDLYSRLISVFYIVYFGIGTANISTYRGIFSAETLHLYSSLILVSIVPILFIKTKQNQNTTKILPLYKFRFFAKGHLILIYAALLFVFLYYGNILTNQAIRFRIPPSLAYIIKSSLIIPLFYPFFLLKSKKFFLIFVVLPILPSLIIGSRGNVVMVILSMLLIQVIHKNFLFKIGVEIKRFRLKKHLVKIFFLLIATIAPLFYIRRIYNPDLLNPEAMLQLYKFPSDSLFFLFILPFHVGFRETIGISNVIISNEYQNSSSDIPLFFLELFTVLPGHSTAPGQILGKEVIGSTLDGGLTPGLLGGLYIDFGILSIFGGAILLFLIGLLYKKAYINDYYLILFALCIIQYLHLFHRGFMKPEYITYIIICTIYFVFTKKEKIQFSNY